VWQFTDGKFVQTALAEGHTRSVTSLLYCAPLLWSASLDFTLRVWDVATGRCEGVIGAGPTNPNGHTGAVACLEAIVTDGETFVASGGAEGDVRLWRTNGEFVHVIPHGVCVCSMKTFQDGFGGQQVLIIGLYDGRIVLRSCACMVILLTIPNSAFKTKAMWSIVNIDRGSSCFATGSEDGQLLVWRITKPLIDTTVAADGQAGHVV